MTEIRILESIYEPLGGFARSVVRVVAPLQLIIIGLPTFLLGLVAKREDRIFAVCVVVFIFGWWLGYEAFACWYRRQKKNAFLTGEPCDAVVVGKRIVHGWHYVGIEFVAAGRRVRTSAYVGSSYAVPLRIGDKVQIRYLRDQPTWWVPAWR